MAPQDAWKRCSMPARTNATHAALVCHPHPMFGGTLHNKVVFHTMKALNSFGFPVLRFNFRGTGLSQGEHDHGNGEVDDVRAALDWLDGRISSADGVCGIFFRRSRRIARGLPRCAGECRDRASARRWFRLPAETEEARVYTFDFMQDCSQAEVVRQRSARSIWPASEAGSSGRVRARAEKAGPD